MFTPAKELPEARNKVNIMKWTLDGEKVNSNEVLWFSEDYVLSINPAETYIGVIDLKNIDISLGSADAPWDMETNEEIEDSSYKVFTKGESSIYEITLDED